MQSVYLYGLPWWAAIFIHGVFEIRKADFRKPRKFAFFAVAVRIEKFSLPFVSASPPIQKPLRRYNYESQKNAQQKYGLHRRTPE